MKPILLALSLSFTSVCFAAQKPVDLYTSSDLHQMMQKLAAKSKKNGVGFAGDTLERYGNHLTMIAYRDKTGSSEFHVHDADIFMVVDGEATLVTGGKLVKAKTESPGELRGTGIEGGQSQRLAIGDVVHIAPNTPHQLKLAPGKTFTYFVVKVHQ
jgi:quercetin dioxygenase-like cupin family protein